MSFDIICFDCDSTLSKIEGIDELGRRVDMLEQMTVLTNAAMNGDLSLEAVYGKRLALIKPDKISIEWLADLYISEMVDGVGEVFNTLQKHGKQVHIISGGIRQAILPLADKLGLADSHVHAVDIIFNEDGSYKGFEQDSVLAKNGGKAIICQQLYDDSLTMAMVGDGKTDLEAKQAGATVIGFGGVAQRSIVLEQADIYLKDSSLTNVLNFLI